MDFLQVALILLIILLAIFLSITGLQVFFILRELKKALDNLNKILQTNEGKEKIQASTQRAPKMSAPSRRLFKNAR